MYQRHVSQGIRHEAFAELIPGGARGSLGVCHVLLVLLPGVHP
jgi:hypothetical protein